MHVESGLGGQIDTPEGGIDYHGEPAGLLVDQLLHQPDAAGAVQPLNVEGYATGLGPLGDLGSDGLEPRTVRADSRVDGNPRAVS
jgi:hypothetical protein